jgi:hypothetical protein
MNSVSFPDTGREIFFFTSLALIEMAKRPAFFGALVGAGRVNLRVNPYGGYLFEHLPRKTVATQAKPAAPPFTIKHAKMGDILGDMAFMPLILEQLFCIMQV